MKTFAIAIIAGLAVAHDSLEYSYIKHLAKFTRELKSKGEFLERLEYFHKSEHSIQELNSRNTRYVAGHNKFSDWSEEEYQSMMGLTENEQAKSKYAMFPFQGTSNGSGLDWREVEGVVTPVKDQGQCGSCWAFSATEAVESAYVIAGNEQVIMAPQELVDCSKGLFSNHGCNGGWYYYAWSWLASHKTMTEDDYPYVSGSLGEATTCSYDESVGVTNVASYQQAAPNTEAIKAAIEIGPSSVAVAAGNDVFRYYTSGIVTADDGCPTSIDHAIVAVGYGYDGDQGYYIVRNSWGTGWGEDGYIMIGMEDGDVGVCGINGYVYFPLI